MLLEAEQVLLPWIFNQIIATFHHHKDVFDMWLLKFMEVFLKFLSNIIQKVKHFF